MRIVDIRERTVPVGSAMRNASIAFDSMTASAVALFTDKGITGYAFDSIGRYGKGAILRERFIPRLLQADPKSLLDPAGLIDPAACARAVMSNEKQGGHGERPGAVGLIEAAVWDLRAKMQGLPLWRSIAEYFGVRDAGPQIAVYASGGHFRAQPLADEIRKVADAGYRRVKIKLAGIDPNEDARRVEQASRSGLNLAVDVNGALAPGIAERWFKALEPFRLEWIEEPASPLDFDLLKGYSSMSTTALATGENLFSFDDARNLLRYGGLKPSRDFVQFDPLLSYGIGEYAKMIAAFESAGWKRSSFLPHAGHLFAVHCVAGLRLGMAEAAPDPALPYGGFWDGVRAGDGRVTIPDLPGVGYEAKENLFRILEST
jgi:L-alanine-DL-glutamate epimerase-like enolase superfamily enzyme